MNKSFKPYHIKLIERELARRKKANPRYSMRALAKFLGIGSSTLSRILLDSQEVSGTLAEKIMSKINLSDEESVLLLASIAEDKRNRANKILTAAITNVDINERLRPIDADWLLSKSPELIYVVNKSKRCLYANEEGAKLHGISPEEMIGKNLLEVGTPPETAAKIEGWVDLVLKKKESFKLEDDYTTETGVRWFERIYQPILDSNSEVQAVVCHLRDITERKNAEQRLTLLAQAGKILTSTFNSSDALSSFMDLMISEFADCCIIHIIDNSGHVTAFKVGHKNPKATKILQDLFAKYPFDPKYPAFYHNVFATGKYQLVSNVDDEILKKVSRDSEHLKALSSLDVGSYVCVPMKAVDKIVGTITMLRSKENVPFFTVSDLSLIFDLSSRAAWTIECSRNIRE